MGNPLNRDDQNCRRFLDVLEELPLSGDLPKSAEEWRAELPQAEEVHAGGCEACRTALRDENQRGFNISDIAYRWGFNDLSHFNKVFRARFDQTPREWRNRPDI